MFKTTIGLEINAQLQTNSKAFCKCHNDSQSPPNTNICPICTGQPGTLPNLNRKMVELALKVSIAYRCTINQRTSFDRKNYFSPDMPKGYQITQTFHPIAKGGVIEILTPKRKKKITISRIHMEEDSARTIGKVEHLGQTHAIHLDFNRSGIPLLEIVTAPEITSPKEAVECFDAIRSTLIYLDACDGHLEAGSLRCDANISLQNLQTGEHTERVEIKNLNSTKNIERALTYEQQRLREGFVASNSEKAITKDYDERLKRTIHSREKETQCDYRYFEEPDLPILEISDEEIAAVSLQIPELPVKRLSRFITEYTLRFDVAKSLVNDRDVADFFDGAMNILDTDEMKHIIIRDVKRYLNQTGKTIDHTQLSPQKLYDLLRNIKTGRISPMIKQKILKILFEQKKDVNTIIEEENLIRIDNRQSLGAILEELIKENEEQYEAYICGKKELLKWFIGQMIKRTKGRTDPKLIINIIKERMGE